MTIRRKVTATATLLVCALASAPIASAIDSDELNRVSQHLNLTVPEVSAMFAALGAHEDHIEAEIAHHDKSRRLTWREFARIRDNARATVKAITPQLGRRKAERALFTLHSALLPQAILPRQRLGVLFKNEETRAKPVYGVVNGDNTTMYPGVPFTGQYVHNKMPKDEVPTELCD